MHHIAYSEKLLNSKRSISSKEASLEASNVLKERLVSALNGLSFLRAERPLQRNGRTDGEQVLSNRMQM